MGSIEETNIKNCTCYSFNDMIDIKNFNSKLLKLDQKLYQNIDIYHIGYITIKGIGDFESIYIVNPLYFIIGRVDGYIKEINASKYLIFPSADKNGEV